MTQALRQLILVKGNRPKPAYRRRLVSGENFVLIGPRFGDDQQSILTEKGCGIFDKHIHLCDGTSNHGRISTLLHLCELLNADVPGLDLLSEAELVDEAPYGVHLLANGVYEHSSPTRDHGERKAGVARPGTYVQEGPLWCLVKPGGKEKRVEDVQDERVTIVHNSRQVDHLVLFLHEAQVSDELLGLTASQGYAVATRNVHELLDPLFQVHATPPSHERTT